MTAESTRQRAISLFPIGFLMLCALLACSSDVIPRIQAGLLLCGKTIIPTLFPCMVACDLLIMGLSPKKDTGGLKERACRFFFNIPAIGMTPFFLGALCGFPIGTKTAADLFRQGKLTPAELDRTLCFSNVTGPVFLVTGIGFSLFGSFKIGLLLYVIQLISALICGGLLARFTKEKEGGMTAQSSISSKRTIDPMSTVPRSVLAMLTVCGYVLLFSAVCGILSSFLQNKLLLLFIYGFLEVGGACAEAANLFLTNPRSAVLLATLAVNFGGMSVHLQAASLLKELPFSFLRYLFAKTLQTGIALLLTAPILPYIINWT